jgi:hypothetical protein
MQQQTHQVGSAGAQGFEGGGRQGRVGLSGGVRASPCIDEAAANAAAETEQQVQQVGTSKAQTQVYENRLTPAAVCYGICCLLTPAACPSAQFDSFWSTME